ncbi:MAG: prolipoprotein diacylglyceryl transferase family protein [Deltaproteobacteria bacterium]
MIPWFEPPALHLGPVTLQIFGILAAIGVAVGVRSTAWAASRRGLDPRPVLEFAIWGVVAGILVGHLVHVGLYHPEELREPRRVLEFWDGLSSFGGLLGGVVGAVLFFRVRGVPLARYGDAFAVGVPTGWAIARIGCFLVHDHPGTRTTFPLAVDFPGGPRHDLGLYEAVVLFAIAGLLWRTWALRRLEGRLLGLLAVLYGAARFLLDFLRASDVPYADARYGGLTPAQFGACLLVAWGAWRLGRPPVISPGWPSSS